MLKIGEFSKLSQLTVKALRFYEREGLLLPEAIDPYTGYRLYESRQLARAGQIKAYRQLGLSIEEIKRILGGGDYRSILRQKAQELTASRQSIDLRLSLIHYFLEEQPMPYSVSVKEIPETIVYYSEKTIPNYASLMQLIPAIGAECMALNPKLKCAEPPYEFCEYLDGEFKEKDILVRHSEAVTAFGVENENIHFKTLPAARVLSLFHKGPYEGLPKAYSYILSYAKENGYRCAGLARECYIDGIWNKDSAEDWLTEIQLPID